MAPFPPPPQDWGQDELTKFIDVAHLNQYATFDHKRPSVAKLVAIDAALFKVGTHMLNPSDLLSPLLMYRSHSAFRAACRMALSTQNVDTYPLIRSCLEYAGYARLIHDNHELGIAWLNRHNDEESLKHIRNAFTHSSVRARIEKDDAKLAQNYEELYQRAIDFGAHPNERGITGSLTITKGEDRTHFTQAYLQGDGIGLDHVLKTLAQAGLTALLIYRFLFPEKFLLLGLDEEIEKIRRGL